MDEECRESLQEVHDSGCEYLAQRHGLAALPPDQDCIGKLRTHAQTEERFENESNGGFSCFGNESDGGCSLLSLETLDQDELEGDCKDDSEGESYWDCEGYSEDGSSPLSAQSVKSEDEEVTCECLLAEMRTRDQKKPRRMDDASCLMLDLANVLQDM